MNLKVQILRCSRRLFIILVSLTMTWFSEKVLISTRCIHGFMSNLIKKSWTVSKVEAKDKQLFELSGPHVLNWKKTQSLDVRNLPFGGREEDAKTWQWVVARACLELLNFSQNKFPFFLLCSGEYYLGYKKLDLKGVSWYNLLHPDCIKEVQTKHRLSKYKKVCTYLL